MPGTARNAIVDRVDRLTREQIAPRAAEYDAAGANPIDSWRVLAREGFLGACIPAANGGLGLDMPTYAGVIRTIARGCANTAMTVHMHSTVMRFIDALGTDAQKRRYFSEVIEHGRLFGSWGSEPAVSLSRSFLMETQVREDGDAYRVDGVKHFCTMALGASRYMVWCALEAARVLPLERLALSPQCGFASTIEGNRISPEEQRAKLHRVAETARAIWGQVLHSDIFDGSP